MLSMNRIGVHMHHTIKRDTWYDIGMFFPLYYWDFLGVMRARDAILHQKIRTVYASFDAMTSR